MKGISPEAEKGICAKCYGRNLGTNKPVTIGEPVGIIAAQSIGEPGTQLTLRTFHIGGATSTEVDVAEVDAAEDGIVEFQKMNTVENQQGETISVSHKGKILIKDPETNEVLDQYKVGYAAYIFVEDGQKVVKDTKLFSWDPYNDLIVAIAKGKLLIENFIEGVTYTEEFDELTGVKDTTVIQSEDKKLQPQFKIVTEDDEEVIIPMPVGMTVTAEDGSYVHPGDVLGKTSKLTVKQSDITGGLPRVQEFFEARTPKSKAIVTEIAGQVSIGDLTKSGRLIFVKAKDGTEKKYVIPPGKRIIVHEGDILENGDALSDGQLDPQDILEAKGIQAAQNLILNKVQEVYRKQGVKIDDKHIGIIIRQMFKKVKIEDPKDTLYLEGEIVDRVKVQKENARIEKEGYEKAIFRQLLMGITKASLLTDSWLSAASFQRTTKVITNAAMDGKVDNLEGLKESIIIGHRVPVGTGTPILNEKINENIEQGKSLTEMVDELLHKNKDNDIEKEESNINGGK